MFELSANVVMALAFSSVFYNLSNVRSTRVSDRKYTSRGSLHPYLSQDTASFQQRAGVIFLAMLLAAFASALEVRCSHRYFTVS